jgi:hypothetical protein
MQATGCSVLVGGDAPVIALEVLAETRAYDWLYVVGIGLIAALAFVANTFFRD